MRWRTQWGPIRTAALIPVKVKVPLNPTIAVYQKLAPKIKEMKAFGMSYREIYVSLKIDKKTISTAVNYPSLKGEACKATCNK